MRNAPYPPSPLDYNAPGFFGPNLNRLFLSWSWLQDFTANAIPQYIAEMGAYASTVPGGSVIV